MATLWIGLTVFYSTGSPQRIGQVSSGISDAPESLFRSDQPYVKCVFCAVFLVIRMNLQCLVHLVTNGQRMQNPGVKECGVWHWLGVSLCKTVKNAAKKTGCYYFHLFQDRPAWVIKTDGKEAYGAIILFLRLLVSQALHWESQYLTTLLPCFLSCRGQLEFTRDVPMYITSVLE